MPVNPALIGKAGEMLVAAELMRRGIEVAYPASDVGVDLLAYQLRLNQATPGDCIPIQVKARSGSRYNFQKAWFKRAPGVVLVHVKKIAEVPEFYVFSTQADVESALGSHAESDSWLNQGG